MIFVSAGHHEQSRGAKFNNITEFDLTVVWANRIAELLDDKCFRIPGGRLKDKVKFINNWADKNSLAVEIHFNSAKMWKDLNKDGLISDDEMVHVGRGSETLYYPGKKKGDGRYSRKGKEAATIIQDSLGQIMKPNRGAKEGWYRMNPKNGPDYFLRRTNCTALIIEPEFIDNTNAIKDNFDVACHAIASGLLEIEATLQGG